MLALMFPGQGTLHPAALPWLESRGEAAEMLERLSALVGPWRPTLDDAQRAALNRHAQPLITGLSIAAWQCLAAALPSPAAVVGYSVGELAAFCAAGVLDAATALALSCDRAEAMERATAGLATGLLAVRAVPPPRLASVCERHGLALAIRLGPDSAIVGGPASALDAAGAELAAGGVRSTRLAVQVASHTPWMEPAAQALAERLEALSFSPPRAPVICNFTAAMARTPSELKRCLAGQLARPILWDACMDAAAERGVRCVLEVGPGTTLASLWRGRHPDIAARSLDDFRSPHAAAAWVARTLSAG
ncbi:MAG: acyltransferase domain-containing protein [Burkholderiales bacterium]|nr:acyltransferase domain-containing protein [Burkholderiales bacterium]